MKYVDPRGVVKAPDEKKLSHPTLSSLAGKTVGILSNSWPSYDLMILRFREQLVEKQKVSKILNYPIPRNGPAAETLLEKIAGECDAVIVGLGN